MVSVHQCCQKVTVHFSSVIFLIYDSCSASFESRNLWDNEYLKRKRLFALTIITSWIDWHCYFQFYLCWHHCPERQPVTVASFANCLFLDSHLFNYVTIFTHIYTGIRAFLYFLTRLLGVCLVLIVFFFNSFDGKIWIHLFLVSILKKCEKVLEFWSVVASVNVHL